MAFVLSNEGEKLLLEAAVGKVAAGNLKLKLFKNDVTPGHADTTGTFTEANYTGYAAATLTTSSWNAGVAGTGTGTGYGSVTAAVTPVDINLVPPRASTSAGPGRGRPPARGAFAVQCRPSRVPV